MAEEPLSPSESQAAHSDATTSAPPKVRTPETSSESNNDTAVDTSTANDAAPATPEQPAVSADAASDTSPSTTTSEPTTEAAAAPKTEASAAAPAADAASDAKVASNPATDDNSADDKTAGEKAAGDNATGEDAAGDAAFGKMVEEAGDPQAEVKVGDRIRGKIVTINDDNTFIDYSGRAEARIATSELRDKDQQVVLRVGDAVSATVSSVDDGVVLTLGRRRGVVHAAKLRVAFESQVPIQGAVKSLNKGGFDVQVGGIRTFCPLSQIDRTYVEDPQQYVGKNFTFRVLRWENGGRNIVVSRRAILEEEAAEKAVETRKNLAVDAVMEGTVTRIQPFGAFVDLGGLEGLLHVSRMGHGRVDDPKQVVQSGQKVSVRVLSIENEGSKKERISLAMADLGPDPWETLTSNHKEGDVVTGKVARLTDFGAFVHLEAGVDGLVHISEIANQRIEHPQELLKVDQEVEVRILRIESDKRRVSLSIRQASGEQPARPRREPRQPRRQEPQPSSSGPLTHTMADQLGALKGRFKDQ